MAARTLVHTVISKAVGCCPAVESPVEAWKGATSGRGSPRPGEGTSSSSSNAVYQATLLLRMDWISFHDSSHCGTTFQSYVSKLQHDNSCTVCLGLWSCSQLLSWTPTLHMLKFIHLWMLQLLQQLFFTSFLYFMSLECVSAGCIIQGVSNVSISVESCNGHQVRRHCCQFLNTWVRHRYGTLSLCK